jgi:hypothetical protein
VLEYLPVFLGIWWLSLFSLFDIKRGEVEDPVLYTGLISTILSTILVWSMQGFTVSGLAAVAAGAGFLAYGWFVYYLGGWGGADAIALGLAGFSAVPLSNSIIDHYLGILTVFAVVTGLYVTGFVLREVARSRDVRLRLINEMQDSRMELAGLFGVCGAAGYVISGVLGGGAGLLLPVLFVMAYAAQEEGLNRQKDIEEVEPGDIISFPDAKTTKIRGVRPEEIENISQDTVTVVSGLKFLPVFPVSTALHYLTEIDVYILSSLS